MQTKALPAEVGAGGVSVNMITKDGGNRFRGDLFGTYTGQSLQSGNVSAEQTRARPDRAERDRRLLRRERRGRRPHRPRQAVVLRQRAPLPRRSLRGEHLQPGRLAGARRKPDLERQRQADLADQSGQPPVGLRRLQLQGSRSSPQTTAAYQFVSPDASYYSPLGDRSPTSSSPRRCARPCCSTPASPGTTSRGRSTISRSSRRRVAAHRPHAVDPDRRAAAVDDAGQRRSAAPGARSCRGCRVAWRAPGARPACSSSTRPTGRTSTRSVTAISSPATATACLTR